MLKTQDLKRRLAHLEHGIHAGELFTDETLHELLVEVIEAREEVDLDLD